MNKIAFALALAASSALTIGTNFVFLPTSAAAMPVFDATNYTQNILQAARALEQINNQVQSLQNEASMLQDMARHLERIDFPELERLRTAMGKIDGLMGEAQGIGFKADQLDEKFRALFTDDPGRVLAKDQRLADAKSRLSAARESFRHTMRVQAEVVGNVREDTDLLASLVERSQGSVGGLQAQQSANQLLALGIKQQVQLTQLLAAEFSGQALDRARQTQAEQDGKTQTRRFLGSPRAYSPTH